MDVFGAWVVGCALCFEVLARINRQLLRLVVSAALLREPLNEDIEDEIYVFLLFCFGKQFLGQLAATHLALHSITSQFVDLFSPHAHLVVALGGDELERLGRRAGTPPCW